MRMTASATDGPPVPAWPTWWSATSGRCWRGHQAEDRRAGWQDRLADRMTHFTGSLRFVSCHLVIYGLWILANLPGVPLPPFDPTYVILAMAASVEAIFLSTFILITQHRMTAQAATRADLDLQVSLLAEHEITRLITLVAAIAERRGSTRYRIRS
jgi:uncharacterized membrane protein